MNSITVFVGVKVDSSSHQVTVKVVHLMEEGRGSWSRCHLGSANYIDTKLGSVKIKKALQCEY